MTRLTRDERRALAAVIIGVALFFLAPWVLGAVAVACGIEVGVVEGP